MNLKNFYILGQITSFMKKLALLLLLLILGCQPVKEASLDTQSQVTEEFVAVAEKAIPAVVSIEAGAATGSGFIIDKEGRIITNYHVIDKAPTLRVYLPDKRIFSAQVIGFDAETDVALIKIKGDNLPVATLGDSDNLKIGQKVAAIGSPFGLESTITTGIVSAKHRSRGHTIYRDFIQTDANVNPGNSGGPLVDLDGNVIGINTFILAKSEGLGFSIPINLAKRIVDELLTKGKITRGFLGVQATNLIQVDDKGNGQTLKGALIKDVLKTGPAGKAGIKPGDVIKKLGDVDIENANILQNEIAWIPVNSTIKITVDRPTKEKVFEEKVFEVTIEERPDKS